MATTQQDIKEPGFFTFRENALMISMISQEQAGEIYIGLCRLFLYGEVLEMSTPQAQEVYDLIAESMERQHEKYVDTVEKNRQNANKRWHPK